MSGVVRDRWRWFRELRDPTAKCARVGHAMQPRTAMVYLYPSKGGWRGGVADRAPETHEVCTRCGLETEPSIGTRISLDGLTMSAARWDELQANGRLVI